MTFLFISGCNISQTNTISIQTLRNFSHSAYSDQSFGVLFDKKKSISRNKRHPDGLRSLRRGRPYCLQVNNFRKVPLCTIVSKNLNEILHEGKVEKI